MSVRKRTWKTAKGETREAWVVAYSDGKGQPHIETFAVQTVVLAPPRQEPWFL
jgi:hypothetical protein